MDSNHLVLKLFVIDRSLILLSQELLFGVFWLRVHLVGVASHTHAIMLVIKLVLVEAGLLLLNFLDVHFLRGAPLEV